MVPTTLPDLHSANLHAYLWKVWTGTARSAEQYRMTSVVGLPNPFAAHPQATVQSAVALEL